MTAATVRQFRVSVPFINVKVTGMGAVLANHRRGDSLVIGLYQGALLPENVAPGEVERLLNGGYVEPIEAAA